MTRFMISTCLLKISLWLTRYIYYKPYNPINKLTMLPYYCIVCFLVVMCAYNCTDVMLLIDKQGAWKKLVKLSFDSLLVLFLRSILILQFMQWDLVSRCIKL